MNKKRVTRKIKDIDKSSALSDINTRRKLAACLIHKSIEYNFNMGVHTQARTKRLVANFSKFWRWAFFAHSDDVATIPCSWRSLSTIPSSLSASSCHTNFGLSLPDTTNSNTFLVPSFSVFLNTSISTTVCRINYILGLKFRTRRCVMGSLRLTGPGRR